MKYAIDVTLFKLREVKDQDHDWLVELHNDPVVLNNMTHCVPITHASHAAWWEKISVDHRQLRLIFEVKGQPAGFAKFYDIDYVNQNCVLGGDIHKQFRGQGYAKLMWTLMLRKCFDEFELYRVGLTTAEYNVIGRHVYEKLGFKEEGRLVKSLQRNNLYYDQILMRMLKPEWDAMEEQT